MAQIKEEILSDSDSDYSDLPYLIPVKDVITLLLKPVIVPKIEKDQDQDEDQDEYQDQDEEMASRMGGCRCSYKTCANTTTPWKTIHFFHYPVKTPEICNQWIKNAEKPQFADLSEDQLRNKVVCEFHFEERWFPNEQKKRLVKGAVPTLDGDNLVKQEPPMNSRSENISPRPSVLPTPKINCISSNGDHAVFLLEDANTVLKMENVESYIIQNGSLVPSRALENGSNNSSQLSEPSNQGYNVHRSTPVHNNSMFQDDGESSKNVAGVSSTGNKYAALYSENSNDRIERNMHAPAVTSSRVTPSPLPNHPPSSSGFQISKHVLEQSVRTSATPDPLSLDTPKRPSPLDLHNQLSKQIRKHSREIASIKNYLRKTKISRPRYNKRAYLLRALRNLIPPTLHSVVKIALSDEGFNPEDWRFFINLYEKSPEVYNMLSREYKWQLPDIEFMKSVINGQSC